MGLVNLARDRRGQAGRFLALDNPCRPSPQFNPAKSSSTPVAEFCQVTLFRHKANNQARQRVMPGVRHDSGPQILPLFRQDSEH
jgi:hypothetical protein